MSFPKAAVRVGEAFRSVRVRGFNKPELTVTIEMCCPDGAQLHDVSVSDVKWINTEAAEVYGIHGIVPVIGVGYGAHVKKLMYEKQHGRAS